MADFGRNSVVPLLFLANGSAPSLGTFVLNANNDGVEFIFSSETGDAITHFVCNVSATAGSPGNCAIALHPVDNTNGRADTGTTHASATFAAAAGINAISLSYTPTLGAKYAFRLTCAGAGASDTVTFVVSLGNVSSVDNGLYVVTVDAGVGTKGANSIPCFGYRTASRSYGNPVKSFITSGHSAGGERGGKFVPPAGWSDTYQVSGFAFCGRTPAAGTSFNFLLYTNPAGGAAASQTDARDTDVLTAATSSGRMMRGCFPGLTAINCGSAAYLVVDFATNIIIYIAEFETAGDAKAWGNGVLTYAHRASTASDFTEDDTRVPLMAVYLADLTEPAAGGGLLTHPGMGGGCRG